jgi:hypothetical protein
MPVLSRAVGLEVELGGEAFMSASLRRRRMPGRLSGWAALAVAALAIAGCTTSTPPIEASAPPPEVAPSMPSQYRPEELVGRWGYGAYHNDADLTRTAAAARAQCGQPVVINRGPNGGVLMYLADSSDMQELALKGSPSGKNYVGPPGEAGGPQDREIVSFDGRTMVLRWIDPEVASRYGMGVYVRCAAEGAAPRVAGRPAAKPAPAH